MRACACACVYVHGVSVHACVYVHVCLSVSLFQFNTTAGISKQYRTIFLN